MSEPTIPPSVCTCGAFFPRYRPSPQAEAKAKLLLEGRKAREKLFPRQLFGEPAWDVLLYLYLADRYVCTSELSNVLQVPHSVTARWIAILAQEGLVRQVTHPDLLALELTDDAYRRMGNYFGDGKFRSG